MTEPATNPEQLTGEALAAAVAEKVMGWRRLGIAWVHGPHAEDRVWYVGHYRPDRDIAQAWEVRNEMVRRGWEVEVCSHGGLSNTTDDVCIMRRDEDSVMRGADNAPTAICLACLAAMEAAK